MTRQQQTQELETTTRRLKTKVKIFKQLQEVLTHRGFLGEGKNRDKRNP